MSRKLTPEESAKIARNSAFASYCSWHSRTSAKNKRLGLPAPPWAPPTFREQPKKTRPSDGQPSGAPFDVEEYETRKADRRASDPEFQKRLAARRQKSREFWEAFKDERAHRDANVVLIGELTVDQESRHRKIWQAVRHAEQAAYIDRVYLDQFSRIKNRSGANRVRGCGAAAKRAGFAS